MLLFFGVEIATIIIIAILLFTDSHLRKRDTIESKRIFYISVLTAMGSVINILSTIYSFYFLAEPGDKWFLVYMFILSLLCCAKEMMSLQIAFGWNLFVDYGIYRSNEHVITKNRRMRLPSIVFSILFIITYMCFDNYLQYAGASISIMNAFTYLVIVAQFLLCWNAVKIVRSAKKDRTPPSFLRLDVFLIPFIIGYVLSFVPGIDVCDYRSICTAIAVVLTWRCVKNRYRYVDPYTGFYNREFLKTMNEYMEKSGYPNETGIFFKAPQSEGKLIPVLDSLKPADAEIFSLGKDEYLLMAGSQRESVIRLMIKSVKLKAAQEPENPELMTTYAIREDDESPEAFTKRLLKLAQAC